MARVPYAFRFLAITRTHASIAARSTAAAALLAVGKTSPASCRHSSCIRFASSPTLKPADRMLPVDVPANSLPLLANDMFSASSTTARALATIVPRMPPPSIARAKFRRSGLVFGVLFRLRGIATAVNHSIPLVDLSTALWCVWDTSGVEHNDVSVSQPARCSHNFSARPAK
jgi:hypothetical protein